MIQSEFNDDTLVSSIFASQGFPIGRMISGSKSLYRQKYPKNLAVFNANILTKDGKIWYGDLDITLDEKKLKEISIAIGKTLYVLREMDYRFNSEEDNPEEAISKAVWSTDK